jgi:aspartate aminotransferase-like enzyme/N-acyl-L-homoserine lactone synthetase
VIPMAYLFRIAKHEHEFVQIHRLNYQTFVEEIPQHEKNENGILIDPFHKENTYLICLKNNEVIGMIAVRDQRPFSLDKKIANVENWLPFQANRLCEIRLLAVKKEQRNGRIFFGLAKLLARYCLKKGYDTAVISGTTRQLKLYKQMGFQPFAYPVGTEDALYQPMFLTKETFEKSLAGRILDEVVSFLPGPVRVCDEVKQAVTSPAISHRSCEFVENIKLARKQLCKLTSANDVQIMLGTGTLANDMIAAQLRKVNGKGFIIVNGEFGERLVDHARRTGLDFAVLRKSWGEPVFKEEIIKMLSANPIAWLGFVHCETSTGMLNDLEAIKEICRDFNVKLCVDCISSLGTMPINLQGVYLASGVSGKGIGAFTGLSFIFHNHVISVSADIPRYLDLGMYCEQQSIPFSHFSNLLFPLLTALKNIHDERYENIKKRYDYIRKKIEEMELPVLVPRAYSATGILTIDVPKDISSVEIGDEVFLQGYQLHYESAYLRERNWLQIACIGDFSQKEVDGMLSCLKQAFENAKASSLN